MDHTHTTHTHTQHAHSMHTACTQHSTHTHAHNTHTHTHTRTQHTRTQHTHTHTHTPTLFPPHTHNLQQIDKGTNHIIVLNSIPIVCTPTIQVL